MSKITMIQQLYFFNQRVVRDEYDVVSFQVSYPMIHSNKFFKSLKCC